MRMKELFAYYLHMSNNQKRLFDKFCIYNYKNYITNLIQPQNICSYIYILHFHPLFYILQNRSCYIHLTLMLCIIDKNSDSQHNFLPHYQNIQKDMDTFLQQRLKLYQILTGMLLYNKQPYYYNLNIYNYNSTPHNLLLLDYLQHNHLYNYNFLFQYLTALSKSTMLYNQNSMLHHIEDM